MERDNSLVHKLDLQSETTLPGNTDVCSTLGSNSTTEEPAFHTDGDSATVKLSENMKYPVDDANIVDVKTEVIDSDSHQNIYTRHTHGMCGNINYAATDMIRDIHVASVKLEPEDETTEHTKFIIEIDTCKDEYYETHGYPDKHGNGNLQERGSEKESGGHCATTYHVHMDHSYTIPGHSSVYTKPCTIVLSDIRYTYPDILTQGYGHVHNKEPKSQIHTQPTEYVPPLQQSKHKPYRCPVCGVDFTKKANMKTHMGIHTGEKPHKCKVCERSFSRKGNLASHMRTHTGEKPYKCSLCRVSFSDKSRLARHMRTHTGEKPYRCPVCEVSFTLKDTLTSHMRTHTREKPYKCSVCGVPFAHSNNLKRHTSTHTGEKLHKCTVCRVGFATKSHLTYHIRTHTGEKPHKCSVCGVGFTQKRNLTSHLKSHTGEKPHECSVCERSFAEKRQLTRHMRTHTREKPYQCSVCGVGFAQANGLKYHRERTVYCAFKRQR